jgi:hypothetical protein
MSQMSEMPRSNKLRPGSLRNFRSDVRRSCDSSTLGRQKWSLFAPKLHRHPTIYGPEKDVDSDLAVQLPRAYGSLINGRWCTLPCHGDR